MNYCCYQLIIINHVNTLVAENGVTRKEEEVDGEADGETEKTPTTDDELPTMTITGSPDNLNTTTTPSDEDKMNANVTVINGQAAGGKSRIAIYQDQSEVESIDCEIKPEEGMNFFCFLSLCS